MHQIRLLTSFYIRGAEGAMTKPKSVISEGYLKKLKKIFADQEKRLGNLNVCDDKSMLKLAGAIEDTANLYMDVSDQIRKLCIMR
jgi:hypothetical protein